MNHVRDTLLSNKWLIREKWNTQILSIFAKDLDTSASTVVPLIIYRTFYFNTGEKSKLHPDQALLLAQICFMITLRIITWRERERDGSNLSFLSHTRTPGIHYGVSTVGRSVSEV